MKQRGGVAAVAVVCALMLAGCGGKERDELRAKVATLEQQLAKTSAELAEKDKTLKDLRSNADSAGENLRQCQAERDALNASLAKAHEEIMTLKKRKK